MNSLKMQGLTFEEVCKHLEESGVGLIADPYFSPTVVIRTAHEDHYVAAIHLNRETNVLTIDMGQKVMP